MKFWMIFLLPATSVFAQQVQVVGGGNGWSLDGRAVPRELPATATLTGAASSEIILRCGESIMLSYACAADRCRVPVCATEVPSVKVSRVDPGAWAAKPKASLAQILSAYFARTPTDVVGLGVRAAENLTDAVVHQAGDKVLWAPVLVRLLEGSYCFQLEGLPAGIGSKRVIFELDWDPEDPGKKDGAAQLPGLAPGIFALHRGTSRSGGSCQIEDPDAAPTWALVVADPRFDAINAEWRSFSPDLAKVAAENSPGVAATLRHMVLANLADSIK